MVVSVHTSNKKAHKKSGIKVFSDQLQIKTPFCCYKEFSHSPILISLSLNITWNLLGEESSECQYKPQRTERPRSTMSIRVTSTLSACSHPREAHTLMDGKARLVLVKSSDLYDSDYKRNLGSSGFSLPIEHTSFSNPFPASILKHAGDRKTSPSLMQL